MPVGTVSAVGIAALEARERFLTLNTLQVLVTALLQLSPLLVAWWRGPELDDLIEATVISRIIVNIPVLQPAGAMSHYENDPAPVNPWRHRCFDMVAE